MWHCACACIKFKSATHVLKDYFSWKIFQKMLLESACGWFFEHTNDFSWSHFCTVLYKHLKKKLKKINK